MCLASLCVSIHSVLQFETNHLITYVLCISFHTAHSACLSSYMVSLHTATYSTKWPLTVWTKLSRHSFWRRKHNLFKQIKILLGPGLNFINFTVDISTWNHKMSKYIYKNETYILLDILWPHHWGESGGHDVVVGARGISQTNDLKHGVWGPEALCTRHAKATNVPTPEWWWRGAPMSLGIERATPPPLSTKATSSVLVGRTDCCQIEPQGDREQPWTLRLWVHVLAILEKVDNFLLQKYVFLQLD